MSNATAVKTIWRPSESLIWSFSSNCWNQMVPDQKNSLLPKVSWTE